jgi:hypothetical protein
MPKNDKRDRQKGTQLGGKGTQLGGKGTQLGGKQNRFFFDAT